MDLQFNRTSDRNVTKWNEHFRSLKSERKMMSGQLWLERESASNRVSFFPLEMTKFCVPESVVHLFYLLKSSLSLSFGSSLPFFGILILDTNQPSRREGERKNLNGLHFSLLEKTKNFRLPPNKMNWSCSGWKWFVKAQIFFQDTSSAYFNRIKSTFDYLWRKNARLIIDLVAMSNKTRLQCDILSSSKM